MRLAGVSGKGKSRSPITTRTPQRPDLRPDLVGREFKAEGPNKLWVADITYVRTKRGFVYARKKALCTRHLSRTFTPEGSLGGRYRARCGPKRCHCKRSTRRSCAEETTGLIHYSDHGSQCVSVVYNE